MNKPDNANEGKEVGKITIFCNETQHNISLTCNQYYHLKQHRNKDYCYHSKWNHVDLFLLPSYYASMHPELSNVHVAEQLIYDSSILLLIYNLQYLESENRKKHKNFKNIPDGETGWEEQIVHFRPKRDLDITDKRSSLSIFNSDSDGQYLHTYGDYELT